MGITVQWDNFEKTVIRYDFESSWTWDDFHAAAAKSGAMTKEVKHQVHLIANMFHSAPLPEGAMLQFSNALRNAPKDRGMFVIVAGDAWMNTLARILGKTITRPGSKFALVATLEEARAIVTQAQQVAR